MPRSLLRIGDRRQRRERQAIGWSCLTSKPRSVQLSFVSKRTSLTLSGVPGPLAGLQKRSPVPRPREDLREQDQRRVRIASSRDRRAWEAAPISASEGPLICGALARFPQAGSSRSVRGRDPDSAPNVLHPIAEISFRTTPEGDQEEDPGPEQHDQNGRLRPRMEPLRTDSGTKKSEMSRTERAKQRSSLQSSSTGSEAIATAHRTSLVRPTVGK